MNINSSIKMGGRFTLGEIDPLSGERISQTPWLDNQVLNAAETYLYAGFPDGPMGFGVGSDDTPVDPTQTNIISGTIDFNVVSETTAPDCEVTIVRAVDNVEEIHVKGQTVFRVEMLSDGIINEVAIQNFCRALVVDQTSGLAGLPVATGMILDVTYEFTLIYRVTRQNPLILEGTATTTDGVDHFVDGTLAFVGSPVKLAQPTTYPWTKLLGGDHVFMIAENIHSVENEFDATNALVADEVRNETLVRTGTFVDPAVVLPTIRSFYFGNQAFGVNYVLVETTTNNSIGLVLESGDQLAFTTTFQWHNA